LQHNAKEADRVFPLEIPIIQGAGTMSRHFEVTLEQITQVVYQVWAESSEEAEAIATRLAMSGVTPYKLLSADVTSCCAEEIGSETEWTTKDHAA
jgi:hypothetical protein